MLSGGWGGRLHILALTFFSATIGIEMGCITMVFLGYMISRCDRRLFYGCKNIY
jgi:hypothetical protein